MQKKKNREEKDKEEETMGNKNRFFHELLLFCQIIELTLI